MGKTIESYRSASQTVNFTIAVPFPAVPVAAVFVAIVALATAVVGLPQKTQARFSRFLARLAKSPR